MNQEQVVKKLLELDNGAEDFTVTFSGKKSVKVDGLYKPEKREIIIHNKNFNDDNALMYTAIHEFAHHLQFTRSSGQISSRVHSNRFWMIFHELLADAEKKGIYENIFRKDSRFIELTGKFKEKFLSVNGHLMKDFGRLLMEAYELCREYSVSFEDYADRELQLHRSTAKTLIKLNSMDIDPEIGYENMKIVAGIREPEMRELATAAFAEGKSPDMVRSVFLSRTREEKPDGITELLGRKERIEKNIEKLTTELTQINKRIDELQS